MSQTVNVSSGHHNEESTLSRLNQIKYSDPCCKSCLFWLHFMSVKKVFHDYLCILCILYSLWRLTSAQAHNNYHDHITVNISWEAFLYLYISWYKCVNHLCYTSLEYCPLRLRIITPILNNSATARSPTATARAVMVPVGDNNCLAIHGKYPKALVCLNEAVCSE